MTYNFGHLIQRFLVASDRLCSVESQYDYILQFLQTRDRSFSLESSQVGKGLSKDTKAQKLAFQHWIEAVALAKDLYHLVVICSGELSEEPSNNPISRRDLLGLHCLVLDTSIFWKSHRVQVV